LRAAATAPRHRHPRDINPAACAARTHVEGRACGSAPERLAVKAGATADAVELVPDGPVIQARAGVGDQEAAVLGLRAQLIPQARVLLERRDGTRVKCNLARSPVLAVADGEPLFRELQIVTVERDHLADSHAADRQEPDQRLVGGGLQRRADPAGCCHQRLDFRLGIQVGDRASKPRR